jgi:hypothetical protein
VRLSYSPRSGRCPFATAPAGARLKCEACRVNVLTMSRIFGLHHVTGIE